MQRAAVRESLSGDDAIILARAAHAAGAGAAFMARDTRSRRTAAITRRDFLSGASGVIGAGFMATHAPALFAAAQAAAQAHAAGAALLHLDAATVAGLEALVARIIPSDETPGAREMGVIHFIDQAVGGFMQGEAEGLREGVASLDARAMEDGGQTFAQLPEAAQDALLGQVEDTPFFGLAHFMTIAGAFALPTYGGNRDHLGWQLIGFEHRHGWAPPFGHYDAEATGKEASSPGHAAGHDHG
jgi:gluconate 2-dehydrogenase gamma chain